MATKDLKQVIPNKFQVHGVVKSHELDKNLPTGTKQYPLSKPTSKGLPTINKNIKSK